jgi:hypothetical protein
MWVCIWKCNLFVGGVVDKGVFVLKKTNLDSMFFPCYNIIQN